jgi:hypothetical protein
MAAKGKTKYPSKVYVLRVKLDGEDEYLSADEDISTLFATHHDIGDKVTIAVYELKKKLEVTGELIEEEV